MESATVRERPDLKFRYSVVRILRRVEVVLARGSRHRILSCCSVALLALGLRLVLLPVLVKPTPQVQDEFSYLLGGETFALGRLTNPPHPMWAFFETMHVNMQPTYAGKYPPGQAAFLAIGIRMFGHPWFGVWLSMGLLCGYLCWMLQGWLPPKYALIGSAVAALQLGVTGYWINSYWGGAVAALGGALVLGAVPRLARNANAGTGLAGAFGIVILANSRPFEGGVLVLLSIAATAWLAHRWGTLSRLLNPRLLVIFLAGGAVTIAAMAYYNWRLTGDPVKLPYVLNAEQYGWLPVFWPMPEPPAPRIFRDSAMEQMWKWDQYQYLRSRQKPLRVAHMTWNAILDTFVAGAGLVLPLLTLAGLLLFSSIQVRVALGLLAGYICILQLEKYIHAHYLAPATALFFLLPMFGLRRLRILKLCDRSVGRPAVAIVLLVALAAFVTVTIHQILQGYRIGETIAYRVKTIQKLSLEPGRHLVLIRYSNKHDPLQELVYNTPEIDKQQIVWAVDRGAIENRRLFAYYPDRKIWLMQPDGPAQLLTPYGFE